MDVSGGKSVKERRQREEERRAERGEAVSRERKGGGRKRKKERGEGVPAVAADELCERAGTALSLTDFVH